MIKTFEKYTEDLNDQEIKIAKSIAKGLETKIGKKNSISSKQIINAMKESRSISLAEPTLRKMINYIRTKKLVKGLCAHGRGYFVASSKEEITDYITSLEQRISSQMMMLNSIKQDKETIMLT